MNEGSVLKNLRVKHGLSQENIAEIIGLKQTYVSKLELGKMKFEKIYKEKIINHFNLEPNYFEVMENSEEVEKIKSHRRATRVRTKSTDGGSLQHKGVAYIPTYHTHKLKEIMIDNKITQIDLARIMGISSGKMSYLMRGLTVFTEFNKQKLISHFKLPSDYFEKPTATPEKVRQTTIEDMMMLQLYKRWEQKKKEAELKLSHHKQLLVELELEVKNYTSFMDDIKSMIPNELKWQEESK